MWWHTVTHGRGSEVETLHTTSEHGVSNITTADAHTSAASSRLNWRPSADLNGLVRFARKTKSGFCACVITFLTTSRVYLTTAKSKQCYSSLLSDQTHRIFPLQNTAPLVTPCHIPVSYHYCPHFTFYFVTSFYITFIYISVPPPPPPAVSAMSFIVLSISVTWPLSFVLINSHSFVVQCSITLWLWILPLFFFIGYISTSFSFPLSVFTISFS